MMPSELRIGNLTNFGKVIEINTVSFYVRDQEGTEVKSTWADVQPVPLTEELLFKYNSKLENLGYNIHFKKLKDSNSRLEVRLGFSYLTSLFFLHQYQNLHFTLTGEELKLK